MQDFFVSFIYKSFFDRKNHRLGLDMKIYAGVNNIKGVLIPKNRFSVWVHFVGTGIEQGYSLLKSM